MPIDALHNCVIFQSWSVVTYLQNIQLIKLSILVLTLVSAAGPAEHNHGGGKQNCKNNMLIVAIEAKK